MSYTSRLTIAVPGQLIDQANQLALLIGESESDSQTFGVVRFTKSGIKYAVSSTACVPWVIDLLNEDSILVCDENDPDSTGINNRFDADLEAAAQAFAAIKQGLILVSTNINPTQAIAELGLVPIVADTDLN